MPLKVARYAIPCRKDALKEMREQLSGLLHENGIDGTLNNQIVLSADEACANAIIHGNDCDETHEIHLEVQLDSKRVKISVSDVGEFQITDEMLSATLDDLAKNRRKGGLGLKLMHAIMDEVHYSKTEDSFICTMVKYL